MTDLFIFRPEIENNLINWFAKFFDNYFNNETYKIKLLQKIANKSFITNNIQKSSYYLNNIQPTIHNDIISVYESEEEQKQEEEMQNIKRFLYSNNNYLNNNSWKPIHNLKRSQYNLKVIIYNLTDENIIFKDSSLNNNFKLKKQKIYNIKKQFFDIIKQFDLHYKDFKRQNIESINSFFRYIYSYKDNNIICSIIYKACFISYILCGVKNVLDDNINIVVDEKLFNLLFNIITKIITYRDPTSITEKSITDILKKNISHIEPKLYYKIISLILKIKISIENTLIINTLPINEPQQNTLPINEPQQTQQNRPLNTQIEIPIENTYIFSPEIENNLIKGLVDFFNNFFKNDNNIEKAKIKILKNLTSSKFIRNNIQDSNYYLNNIEPTIRSDEDFIISTKNEEQQMQLFKNKIDSNSNYSYNENLNKLSESEQNLKIIIYNLIDEDIISNNSSNSKKEKINNFKDIFYLFLMKCSFSFHNTNDNNLIVANTIIKFVNSSNRNNYKKLRFIIYKACFISYILCGIKNNDTNYNNNYDNNINKELFNLLFNIITDIINLQNNKTISEENINKLLNNYESNIKIHFGSITEKLYNRIMLLIKNIINNDILYDIFKNIIYRYNIEFVRSEESYNNSTPRELVVQSNTTIRQMQNKMHTIRQMQNKMHPIRQMQTNLRQNILRKRIIKTTNKINNKSKINKPITRKNWFKRQFYKLKTLKNNLKTKLKNKFKKKIKKTN